MHVLPIRYGMGTVHSGVNKVSLCLHEGKRTQMGSSCMYFVMISEITENTHAYTPPTHICTPIYTFT